MMVVHINLIMLMEMVIWTGLLLMGESLQI